MRMLAQVIIVVGLMLPLHRVSAAVFDYTALDARGIEVSGTIRANDEAKAINALRKKGLYPTRVAPASWLSSKMTLPTLPKASSSAKPSTIRYWVFSAQDELGFFEDLSMFLKLGVEYQEALSLIGQSNEFGPFSTAATEMALESNSKLTLSELMGRHPGVFSKFSINILKAGELGGVLDHSLPSLLQRLRREAKFLPPPWFWIVISGLSLCTMILGCLRFFPGNANWKRSCLVGSVIVLILIAFNAYAYRALIHHRNMEGFFGQLGTATEQGVPILQSLNIVRDDAKYPAMKNLATSIHLTVREGDSIMSPFTNSGLVTPTELEVIDIGEESGQLPDILKILANRHFHRWEAHRQDFVQIHQFIALFSIMTWLLTRKLPVRSKEPIIP